MRISFFEEFPNEENLKKLDLIDFPTKLYITSKSIKEFYSICDKIKNKNVTDLIYWPILDENEGYWLSPWSKRAGLERVIKEVKNSKVDILWDAELPKERYLILTGLHNFFRNKKLILDFFKNYKNKIYTAEYLMNSALLNFSCLNFNPAKFDNYVVKMMYTSMRKYPKAFFKREIKYYKKLYGDKFIPGLGVIAQGISGDEPILKPKTLRRDLSICKTAGLDEVVIFRLGGLNKEYLNVIKWFYLNP